MSQPAKHLLIDPRVVARSTNATLVMGKARKHPANPLFGEDRPWEDRFDNGYPNVVYDAQAGLYRCWYDPFMYDQAVRQTPPARRGRMTYLKAMQALRDPHHRTREMGVCYAQSRDGVHWDKPELGLIDWDGRTTNNIVVRDNSLGDGLCVHGSGVMLDPREQDPAGRYKMLTRLDRYEGTSSKLLAKWLATAVSPDGLRWSDPQPCEGVDVAADTHNFPLWAPTLGKYVAITRHKVTGADGKTPVRVVAWTASRDWRHWCKPRIVLRGLDDALQIYSMPVTYHAGLYIGLAAIFNTRTDRVHTELAVSPDTKTWQRVCPGTPLVANTRRRGGYDWGCVYSAAPIFGADAVRVYYVGNDGRHFDWRKGYFCLASFRPDGLAGMAPRRADEPASITTAPLRIHRPSRLTVSADIARGGHVQVGVVGDPKRSLRRCIPLRRSGSDVTMAWGTGDLIPAGQIQLAFRLDRATLYAFGMRALGDICSTSQCSGEAVTRQSNLPVLSLQPPLQSLRA